MHDALAELLGLFLDSIVDLSGTSDEPSAPAARVPRIGECFVAKSSVQLTAAVITGSGQLSGRFKVTLLAGDIVRVESLSSRGPRALLVLDEPCRSPDGEASASRLSAQHALVTTFKVLEQQFDRLLRPV